VTHTISFRRPELFYVLSKMVVPPGADVVAQIHHLEDLGYKIVEVSPPLGDYGPPQRSLPRPPQLLAACDPVPALPTTIW
jgi:hypothetical protein